MKISFGFSCSNDIVIFDTQGEPLERTFVRVVLLFSESINFINIQLRETDKREVEERETRRKYLCFFNYSNFLVSPSTQDSIWLILSDLYSRFSIQFDLYSSIQTFFLALKKHFAIQNCVVKGCWCGNESNWEWGMWWNWRWSRNRKSASEFQICTLHR